MGSFRRGGTAGLWGPVQHRLRTGVLLGGVFLGSVGVVSWDDADLGGRAAAKKTAVQAASTGRGPRTRVRRLKTRLPPRESYFPELRLAGPEGRGEVAEARADSTTHIATPSLVAPAAEPTAPPAAPATPLPAPAPGTPAPAIETTCRPVGETGEAKVTCTNGKTWTMRSAALILPPVLRCSTKQPECCDMGFRSQREVQTADLLRFGQGQAPACHMQVRDFLTHPPVGPGPRAGDELDGELPPGLRQQSTCPRGQTFALGGCYDAAALFKDLRQPPLADPNRVLVPEAAESVQRMRQDFDATGRCPQSALDIEVLRRIYYAAQLRLELAADTPLFTTPLLVQSHTPFSASADPRLPAACGYNATFKTWYQTSYHCPTDQTCYAQSHPQLPHTCVRFDRATTQTGGSPYFWPFANCQNVPSCIAVPRGECTGVARLTALGRGVFLLIQETPTGDPYYYGVIFARPRERTSDEAKRAERAQALLLDMARNLPSEPERQRLRDLVRGLAGELPATKR